MSTLRDGLRLQGRQARPVWSPASCSWPLRERPSPQARRVKPDALADLLNGDSAVAAGEIGEASVNLSDALLAAGFSQEARQSSGFDHGQGAFLGLVGQRRIEGLHRSGPVPRVHVREPEHYDGAIDLDRN